MGSLTRVMYMFYAFYQDIIPTGFFTSLSCYPITLLKFSFDMSYVFFFTKMESRWDSFTTSSLYRIVLLRVSFDTGYVFSFTKMESLWDSFTTSSLYRIMLLRVAFDKGYVFSSTKMESRSDLLIHFLVEVMNCVAILACCFSA